MKDIALIASYPELAELGLEIARKIDVDLEIEYGLLGEAVPIAKRLQDNGCQVIITRGGTYRVLKQANLGIPIVDIRFTGYDFLRTLQEARSVGSYIGVFVSWNMGYDISDIGAVLNLRVKEYFVEPDKKTYPAKLRVAKKESIDVIVAGLSVCRCAQGMGIPSFLVQSGRESVEIALNEAKELASIRRVEQEKANRMQAILEFAYEGIIAFDIAGSINMINFAAEKLLGIPEKQALGHDWREVIPEFKLENIIAKGQREIAALAERKGKHFVINKIPIYVRKENVGGVVTFQEVSGLQNIEQDIRKKLNPKGHTAKYSFNEIIGESSEINRCIKAAKEFAKVQSSVLILGETGVGKELFAQSIHNESKRSDGPFVAINCAVIPENLLESELFGYSEGAFTGARKKGRAGLFEQAHGGTIFLDELGEMAPKIQARLLRVLEEKEVMRLGDEKVITIDVRVIAATNKNLRELIEQRLFREDLFYRLNVLKLTVPALRQRNTDIPLLVCHFLKLYNCKFGKYVIGCSDEAMRSLISNSWPGNIRQLENLIECLVVQTGNSIITVDDVGAVLSESQDIQQNNKLKDDGRNEHQPELTVDINKIRMLEDYEEDLIKRTLEETQYNYSKTAHILGINRTTLWRKLKKQK